VPLYVYASPALSSTALGLVYFGLEDGRMLALKVADGSSVWEFQTGGAVYSTPTIGDDGTLYFGSNDHFVYAVNGETGKQRWRFHANDEIWTCAAVSDDGVVFIASQPNGTMFALDAASGAMRWAFPIGLPIFSSPSLYSGQVLFGADDGFLHAVDQTSGAETWRFKAGEEVHWPLRTSPAISLQGHAIVHAWPGQIYAVDVSTGKVCLRVSVSV
jgi:outer membrane protein assembly factor BamB